MDVRLLTNLLPSSAHGLHSCVWSLGGTRHTSERHRVSSIFVSELGEIRRLWREYRVPSCSVFILAVYKNVVPYRRVVFCNFSRESQ